VTTATPDIVLHHYPLSPFAEKVRAVLGFKQLAWKSVIIPAVLPKPDVVALTGGYRKTPILQIGRDVYCDTALICDVLEHLQPAPALYPAQHKGMARILAQWADTTLFWAAMAYNFQPKGAAAVFADAAPEAAQAFGADRAAMRGGAARQLPGDAAAAYKSYLRRLADMLESQDYLLGDAPCIADFAAYHPLWFTRTQVPVLADILSSTPAVLAWMDRVQAFGHGSIQKFSAGEAIALCAASTQGFALHDSRFQDEHGIPLGSQVTIAAESFGTETTQGSLVGASRTRYTLQRQDPRAGTVMVHFPRIGYVLKKVDV
jgi:glutathione S-transferase